MTGCNSSGNGIRQTPEESILYTLNWPARGLAPGVTITDSDFTQSSTEFTLSNEDITGDDRTTTFQLTGGVPGKFYTLTNTVMLSTGETWQETIAYECIANRFI